MRILRLIATVDPRTGGPIEGLVQSSKALASLGHHTEIATLDAPGAPWVADAPFPTHALGPRLVRYGFSPRYSPWIARNAHRFDLAIVHGIWNYTSVGAWRALAQRLPYVVFTHGSLDPWHQKAYPLKHIAKQGFWLALEGRVLADAFAVLFTTEEEQRLARKAHWGHQGFRDRVVSYGTADVTGDPESQKAAFRRKLNWNPERRYLLFLSRIHGKKGIHNLLRAFARCADIDPGLDLVIAGPDQDGLQVAMKELSNELNISERIHWPGMLRGDEKIGAYRGAEAFVLPSHGENFGIVVAEAMACGTPVLISDKVNIWREVERSGSGFIAPDNESGAVEVIQRFLRLSPDERSSMGNRARETFLAHFEIQKAANDLIEIAQAASNR